MCIEDMLWPSEETFPIPYAAGCVVTSLEDTATDADIGTGSGSALDERPCRLPCATDGCPRSCSIACSSERPKKCCKEFRSVE
jgi:hypothetical protein